MQEHERDFLIAEYEQAWAMILNIDERRLKFVEYYSGLFTAVIAVGATLITWRGLIDIVVAGPLTVLLLVAVLVGITCSKMIESERSANLRYRRKINLLRGVFLEKSADESIQDYVRNHDELGILTPNLHPTKQPTGTGSTLPAVLLALKIEVGVMVFAIPALWVFVLLGR